ncbi:MAG: hypothetical protein AAFO94_04430, partial [Bacteroidota bacterium]
MKIKYPLLIILLSCSFLSLSAQQYFNNPEHHARLQLQSARGAGHHQSDAIHHAAEKKFTPTNNNTEIERWNKIATNAIPPGHRVYSLKMVDSLNAWMTTTIDGFPPPANELPAVLRTTDGGATWQQYTVDGSEGYYAFDIAPLSDTVAYVSIVDPSYDIELSHFYKTTDGGASWTQVDNYPYFPLCIDFVNEKDGWAMGGDTIVDGLGFTVFSVTNDGGMTWQHAGGNDQLIAEGRSLPAQDSTERLWTWAFSLSSNYESKDSLIILGSNKNYWISKDLGYNWNAFESPLYSNDSLMTTVATIMDDQHFMLGSGIDLQFQIATPTTYVTSDGGTSWTKSTVNSNLSDISYIPGTAQSILAIGHNNFGSGHNFGTWRTDDGVTWTLQDDNRSIVMDFIGQRQGLAGGVTFGGNEGEIYAWGGIPDYDAVAGISLATPYTVLPVEHFGGSLDYQYTLENLGLNPLEDIGWDMRIFKDGVVIDSTTETTTVNSDTLGVVSFSYVPDPEGSYEFVLKASHPELGDEFFQDTRRFEFSEDLLARDDGSPENSYGFGFADTTWYGYYGSEFELLRTDTIASIGILVSPFSDLDGTFHLQVNAVGADNVVAATPLFKSEAIRVADASISNYYYTYQLEERI